MKTIAVIKKNNCKFDEMEKYARPLLYKEHSLEERKKLKNDLNNYIWSVIEPYVEFINFEEDDDFMTIACYNATKCFADKDPDYFFYHTEGSYSFPKKYIEMIYAQPLWNDYPANTIENMNNIACLFSLKHHVIENNCVILANKYDLSAPFYTSIDSINKDDIIRIIRRRYFFTAILIKNNNIVKYYYQEPKYLITHIYGLSENDKIEKLSTSLLKYNLVFYFQHDKSKYVNKIATRINGSFRLHGDVLMLHEMEENIFANISIHEAKRLNVLSYGRLYDRQLKDDEIHTIPTVEVDENGNQTEKKTTPLWSRYIVGERRMIKWNENKDKCINCFQKISTPIICDLCYRAKYCSINCKKEFKHYHDDECINPKSL